VVQYVSLLGTRREEGEGVYAVIAAKHVGKMAAFDANRHGSSEPSDASQDRIAESSSVRIGTARPDHTRAWLFLAAVVMALWFLASVELGR
jgi:hypothetical protein